MNKILTSPSSFGKISPEPFNILKNNGFQVINNPYGRKLTESEVVNLAKECVGIVAGVEPLNENVLSQLKQLKCISRVGVGMDNIDLNYARLKNISVVNTPDGPTRSVAEFTIALTLSLLKKIPQAHNKIINKKWSKYLGNLIFGKKIGIIGLGRIGKMTAKLFRNLGNVVIAYDIKPDKVWAKENQVEIVSLENLIGSSDIITIHVPGSSSESPMISSSEINNLKNGAFLVNVARGGVVDENALYEALLAGKIAGAAIDVFKDEPYYGDLIKLDNVILTPHMGSYAKEGKLKMEIDAVNNIIKSLI